MRPAVPLLALLLATPALAERVGRWSAEHEQDAVRDLLRAEHGVSARCRRVYMEH